MSCDPDFRRQEHLFENIGWDIDTTSSGSSVKQAILIWRGALTLDVDDRHFGSDGRQHDIGGRVGLHAIKRKGLMRTEFMLDARLKRRYMLNWYLYLWWYTVVFERKVSLVLRREEIVER